MRNQLAKQRWNSGHEQDAAARTRYTQNSPKMETLFVGAERRSHKDVRERDDRA
ncbi:hypothetical protein COEREDRAFT_90291 [Coemansia reversa NRRL 1564]|uniref:Uncharacterized protein n=1 Tax=Coemansia reversa (strain ATCC 12441 / NRRL 1564) TaxID=763665 RepID=A0A2G5BKM9_COERN|nr:hypothetical protein COEREDRAFT_90291 [Coemansia reversa NRRL 1564]|eukprot:PIA19566.1 hypothetical protein COEREDRAFT_90291 [Coemansia reversa NRRL 1564]